jgi:ABC-type nitrate/sulfonate/bicarbonate transport system substrate-binding protein
MTPSHPTPPLRLAVGHRHFSHRAAPICARELGFFAEAGIGEIDIVVTGDDQLTVQALAAGDVDIALDVAPLVVMEQKAAGKDLVILGAMVNGLGFVLIGNKGIDSLEALRGRRIQVVENGGAIDERQFRVLLTRNGMDADRDVTLVRRAPYPLFRNARAAFENGDCDARMVLRGEVPEVEAAGYPILFDFFAEYPAGYPQRSIVVLPSFLKAEPERLQGFLQAMVRAYRFIRDDRNYAQVMGLMRQHIAEPNLGMPSHMPADFLDKPYFAFKQSPADGSISLEGLQLYIDERSDIPAARGARAESFVALEPMRAAAQAVDQAYGAA